VKVIIEASRQGCPDSRDLLEVGDTGPHDPLQPTEVLQELAPLCRAQARNHLEHRFVIPPRPFAAVAGDGKAMRLITYTLHEP
jgi:hypothetical protein